MIGLIQILCVDHDQLSSQYIRCKIEEHNDYVNDQLALDRSDPDDPNNDNDNDPNGPPDEDLHVMVGSRQRPRSFDIVEMMHGDNPGFERFRIKVNNFLNYTPVGRVLLDHQNVQNIQLKANNEIRIHGLKLSHVHNHYVYTGYRVSLPQSQL